MHTSIKDGRSAINLSDSRRASGDYLHQRSQGEADAAFDERAKISRYPNHMATLVDSYVGGVFAVEDKIRRTWGPKMGAPGESGTIAHTVWTDIDGSGTNWMTRLIQKSADLIVDGEVWYYGDRTAGRSRIFIIDPDRVVQYREEEGRLVEALVEEYPVRQDSLMDDPVETHEYIHYTVDGFTRYRVDDKTGELSVVEEKTWKFPFWDGPDKQYRRLPIGRLTLPLSRPVGYQMARDANMLYNMLSDARWLYRVMNYPRLTGDVDDKEWENSMNAIRDGMNALQGKWDYISPPHQNAASVYSDYRNEVREFYISNHQRANQSAIERSATEVLYNEASGRTAFLTLLCQTVDEMENAWLSLVAQMEFPKDPLQWASTSVTRSKDFRPVDSELSADSRANRFAIYSSTLPLPLALEFSGFSHEEAEAAKDFNPVPEDDFFEEESNEDEPEDPILV